MRRWSAVIEVEDRKTGLSRSIGARLSQNDLQAEQAKVAVAQAAEYATPDTDVMVRLYKETKTHGVQRDRTFYLSLNRAGRVVYQ